MDVLAIFTIAKRYAPWPTKSLGSTKPTDSPVKTTHLPPPPTMVDLELVAEPSEFATPISIYPTNKSQKTTPQQSMPKHNNTSQHMK